MTKRNKPGVGTPENIPAAPDTTPDMPNTPEAPQGETGNTPDTVDTAGAPALTEDDGFPKHTKAEILKSAWYSHKRTVLKPLLEDDKEYSFEAVEQLLK